MIEPSLIAFEDEDETDGLVCDCGSTEFKVYPDESLVCCVECQLYFDIYRVLH